jgi:RNA polymerase sigma factor (sigma-70 family)
MSAFPGFACLKAQVTEVIMNSEADPPDLPAGDDMSTAAATVRALLPEDADKRVHALFACEYKLLVSYVMGLGVTRVEAEDIAAQAFAQILQSKNLSSISELRAFLYKTAENITFNRHNHLAMQRRNDPLLEAEHSENSPSPEPGLMEQQLNELLHHTLAQLPPRCREFMHLRYWQQLTYPQIVERLRRRGIEINEKTVRRDIIKGVEECRNAIRAAEGPKKEVCK